MKAPPTKPTRSRGRMKPSEIKPLVMAARKAYELHLSLGNLDPGDEFDSWRHRACMEAVKKPGLTACDHDDFKPLLAHFQLLSGDESGAYRNLSKTGKPTDHAAPGDTHEARRQLAHIIGQILALHIHLATTPVATLLEECVGVFAVTEPGVAWEASSGPAAYRTLMDRRAAIDSKGKGPIGVGYVVYLVRQKTRRPTLFLGQDWQAGLAERCTVNQLRQIRDTLVNRIAAVEGVGSSRNRNKSKRSPKAKAERDPKQIQTRW